MHRNNCPLCENSDLQIKEKETELWMIPSPGKIAMCKGCGFRFVVNPKEEFITLEHYDPEEYHHHHGDKRVHFRKRCDELWRLAPGGKLLDIGCAQGQFLEVAREVGFDAYGVEPSEYAASVAKNKGLNVLHGFVSDLPDSEYDVVHSNHVLEHVPDPVAFMKDAARVLKPEGFACIEAPNEFDNLPYILNRIMGTVKARSIFSPHINFFDIRSLRNLFAETGLRVFRWYSYTLLASSEAQMPRLRLLPNNVVRRLGDLLKKGRNIACFLRKTRLGGS